MAPPKMEGLFKEQFLHDLEVPHHQTSIDIFFVVYSKLETMAQFTTGKRSFLEDLGLAPMDDLGRSKVMATPQALEFAALGCRATRSPKDSFSAKPRKSASLVNLAELCGAPGDALRDRSRVQLRGQMHTNIQAYMIIYAYIEM